MVCNAVLERVLTQINVAKANCLFALNPSAEADGKG